MMPARVIDAHAGAPSPRLVQSMTSQLIVRFRDRILSGAYPPGSALRQDTLAAEFGTSKIPVREALVRGGTPNELHGRLRDAAIAFADDAPQADDLTVVAFGYRSND